MTEYDLPTTMNGGAPLLALLGLTLAVVMLAILRQRAAADTAAPQSPAPARPCLCGHGALDHDDSGDCAGVYTSDALVVLCTCTHYMRQGVAS